MDTIFGNLFILTIPVLEKIIRPIIVYFFSYHWIASGW
jgi:hypothetical protein